MDTGTRRNASKRHPAAQIVTIVTVSLAGLLLACEKRHGLDPPRGQQTASRVGRVPEAPPPPPPQALEGTRGPYQYPVWREPPRPALKDPLRDPAVRPRLLRSAEPEYTETARKARIGGIVILELIIEADGVVGEARVLKPLPMGLDQKAIEAVREWRFAPAEDPPGNRVRAIHNVTVNFRL